MMRILVIGVGLALIGLAAVVAEEPPCWQYRLCHDPDHPDGGPGGSCTDWDVIDMNDQCWRAQTGWNPLNSGTNPKTRWHYQGVNLMGVQDVNDLNCNDDRDEMICPNNGVLRGTVSDPDVNVTWYGPLTPCP